jgi:hypothetical protein
MNGFHRFLRFLLRVLQPGTVWSILLFLIGGAGVIITLSTSLSNTVIGYISYVISAYALTSLIVSFPKMRADSRKFISTNRLINRVKTAVYTNKYGNLIVTDISVRVTISLYASLSVNLLYVGYRLFAAFYYKSFWFGAEAGFYIILSCVRFILLRNVRKSKGNLRKELLTYRFCGYLLFAMNVALVGVAYQMIYYGMSYHYPGLLIYPVAMYAFFCLSVAVVQVIQYQKYKSPVLSAVKAINLAKALIAMFSLQTAMFASFGGDKATERIMNSITGGLVCCAIFALAVLMVVRAFNELKNIVD